MELLCWALLKPLYLFPTLPESQPGARSLLWHSHRAAHRQNGCTEHSWFAASVHTQRTLCWNSPAGCVGPRLPRSPSHLHQPQAGVPKASAAFRGRDAREDNAVCLPGRSLYMPSCPHPMRVWPHRERSSGRGRAGSVAPSPGKAAGGQGGPRPPRAQEGIPAHLPRPEHRIAPEQRRARKPTGARIPGGSNLPGLASPVAAGPARGRPRPPQPRRAQEGTWWGTGARPRSRPGPPVPSPGVARERAERREPAAVPAGGCPARVSAFSLGGEDIFTLATAPLPHRAPAPSTRTPRRQDRKSVV